MKRSCRAVLLATLMPFARAEASPPDSLTASAERIVRLAEQERPLRRQISQALASPDLEAERSPATRATGPSAPSRRGWRPGVLTWVLATLACYAIVLAMYLSQFHNI